MPNPSLRLGTRGSALALVQAGLVRDLLTSVGERVELVTIVTGGDEQAGGRAVRAPRAAERARRAPPPTPAEDKSRFVKEIEQALLAGEVDLAVHSAKDVPSELPAGLEIVGVTQRADARDALVSAAGADRASAAGAPRASAGQTSRASDGEPSPLHSLAAGASVGTASLRRRAQLLAARPDLDVRPLRGNVDTRLRRLAEGQVEAVVLAAAGLERLGIDQGAPIPEAQMTPAPGQGCLALEARTDDQRVRALTARLTHQDSLTAHTAERALVAGVGASCHTPVGAHARLEGRVLRLDAFAGLPDGSAWIRDSLEGAADDPAALGTAVAGRMMAAGAAELLAEAERWAR